MNLQDIYDIALAMGSLRMLITFNEISKIPTRHTSKISIEEQNELLTTYKILLTPTFDKAKELYNLLEKYSISKLTQDELNKLVKAFEDLEKEKLLDRFKKYQKIAVEIKERLLIWDDRIFDELGNIPITQPYLNGNLNAQKLLKGIEYFLDSTTWENMQENEKEDLQDFVTCYLNKSWTPAGIMGMRVIESSVRKYYTSLTGQIKTKWWQITDELLDHPKADKELVQKLDYIREHVRNPLAHPEQRLNCSQAEEIFHQGIFVLNKIYG
ncbi:MAG: hypothetical protein JXA54_00315 [Candidatus Heimdallarchaeota archaeon]|nr:hypothetical protein [Candidatus Heimdallarchaeota archaeon]